MNFLSRDFLYHLGLSKTTYRGIWNRSNVWRLGSLCLRTSHGKEFRIGVNYPKGVTAIVSGTLKALS